MPFVPIDNGDRKRPLHFEPQFVTERVHPAS